MFIVDSAHGAGALPRWLRARQRAAAVPAPAADTRWLRVHWAPPWALPVLKAMASEPRAAGTEASPERLGAAPRRRETGMSWVPLCPRRVPVTGGGTGLSSGTQRR